MERREYHRRLGARPWRTHVYHRLNMKVRIRCTVQHSCYIFYSSTIRRCQVESPAKTIDSMPALFSPLTCSQ